MGEVGDRERAQLGDEVGESSEGVLGDLISVGVGDAARGVEVIGEGLLALAYGEFLVLPWDI